MFINGDWYTGKVSWIDQARLRPTKWYYRALRFLVFTTLGVLGLRLGLTWIAQSYTLVGTTESQSQTKDLLAVLFLMSPMLLACVWAYYVSSRNGAEAEFKERRFSEGDVGFDLVFIPQVVANASGFRVKLAIDDFLEKIRRESKIARDIDWFLRKENEPYLEELRHHIGLIAVFCDCKAELMSHFDTVVEKRRRDLRAALGQKIQAQLEQLDRVDEDYEYQSAILSPSK